MKKVPLLASAEFRDTSSIWLNELQYKQQSNIRGATLSVEIKNVTLALSGAFMLTITCWIRESGTKTVCRYCQRV